ncbi:MAG: oligosaccharide flippase family protein [Hyphomicrobium sp.]
MLKNSLIALQGTVVAQGLGILFLTVLTRLYSPETFGLLQLYVSPLMLLTVLASLRYEFALLRAKTDGELQGVLQLCICLNILFTLVVLAGCATLIALRPSWIVFPDPFLWLLTIGVLFGGLQQTLHYVFLREQFFAANSIVKILQVAAFGLGGIAGWFAGLVQFGMIGADVVARVVAVAAASFWLFRSKSTIFTTISWANISCAAKRFREYPLYSVPGGIFSVGIGTAVPIFILMSFGASVVGQYALMERTILAPAGMIGQAVSQAFTAQLSASMIAGENCRSAFRRVVLVMLALGLAPALVLFSTGPRLFAIVFGDQWSLAGEFSQAASVVFLSSLAMAPVHAALVVTGHLRQQLTWEITRFVSVVLTWAVILYFAIPPVRAIALYAGVLTLMNIFFLATVRRVLQPNREIQRS